MPSTSFHPAENRGYRELYASAQELVRHWGQLAELVSEPTAAKALERGVAAAERLLGELTELTPRYGVYGWPAARGLGYRVGGVRAEVRNRFLERNQALRLALLEVQHLRTLIGYLMRVAEARQDTELVDFGRSWDKRLSSVERQMRTATQEAGRDPDLAIAPLDPSPAGRAGQRVAATVGAFGEWIDRRTAGRE